MSVSRAAKNDACFMKVQYKYAYYGRLLNNKTLNITFFVAVQCSELDSWLEPWMFVNLDYKVISCEDFWLGVHMKL